MKALLLSAGLGTRLRPHTLSTPKPCIPFMGVPLAAYSLYLLQQTSCRDVVANLHYLPEKVQSMLTSCRDKDFSFKFSLEKEKPMGSGGALFYAKQFLTGSQSFYAINSDEVFVPSRPDILQKLAQHHQSTNSLATLLVTDHPDLGKSLKPVWIDPQGNIIAFGEKPAGNVRPVHYTGCKIFSEKVLELLPEGESHIFHDTLMPAILKGATVNTVFDSCNWWETGDIQSYNIAKNAALKIFSQKAESNYFQKVRSFWLGDSASKLIDLNKAFLEDK